MNRDMDLVRRILLELENSEEAIGLGWVDLDLDQYSDAQIGYHIMILNEAGLLEADNVTSMGSDFPEYRPKRLTWMGHEFLSAAKNEGLWTRAKEMVAEKGGTIPFAVLQSLLIELSRRQFGL